MEEELTGILTGEKVPRISLLLTGGGVAVLPTDTIYGLHCLASDVKALGRIISLKGRGQGAGFILLVSDMDMADRVVSSWPSGAREWLSRLWPASLTAVLPASGSLHPSLRPEGGVAVRIPKSGQLRRIVSLAGSPLISTSVNRSGMPPLRRMSDIRKEFPGLDAYITRAGRHSALPSTVVDLREAPYRVLRMGAFDPGAFPAAGRVDERREGEPE